MQKACESPERKPFGLLLLAAIIVVVLVLGGCTKKPGTNPLDPQGFQGGQQGSAGTPGGPSEQPAGTTTSPPQAEDPAVACTKLDSQAKADQCLTELAKSRKDSALCGKLTVLSKDRCLKDVAIARSDKELCSAIGNAAFKDECRSIVGKATNDAGLCLFIYDYAMRQSCVDSAARAKNSVEGCRGLEDAAMRDSCITSVAAALKDPAACEFVSTRFSGAGYEKDQCYMGARNDVNGEYCFRLISDDAKSSCFYKANNIPSGTIDCSKLGTAPADACNYWLAGVTGQASYCYSLRDANKSGCLAQILKLDVGRTACLAINSASIREDCLKKWAVDTNNTNNCGLITSNYIVRNTCIRQIAVNTRDEKTCMKMSAVGRIDVDDCMTDVAAATEDYTKCDSVKTESKYFGCFAKVAMRFNAPEICDKATRQLVFYSYTGREHCYRQYAVEKGDAKACDSIRFSDIREECAATLKGK